MRSHWLIRWSIPSLSSFKVRPKKISCGKLCIIIRIFYNQIVFCLGRFEFVKIIICKLLIKCLFFSCRSCFPLEILRGVVAFPELFHIKQFESYLSTSISDAPCSPPLKSSWVLLVMKIYSLRIMSWSYHCQKNIFD